MIVSIDPQLNAYSELISIKDGYCNIQKDQPAPYNSKSPFEGRVLLCVLRDKRLHFAEERY